METSSRIIKIVDVNLIYCLIPMILTLMLIEFLFKNRFPTKKLLNIISWIIIFYSALTLIHFVIGFAFYHDEFASPDKATGSYRIAYWIMFLSATLFPLTLLIKKLRSKFWYVFLVAFSMKIGPYFEQFVIITTSMHRDYASANGSSDLLNLWAYGLFIAVLQGVFLVVLALGILKIAERKKAVHNS